MFSLNLVSGISAITKTKKKKKNESEKKRKQTCMSVLNVAEARMETHLPVGVTVLVQQQLEVLCTNQ